MDALNFVYVPSNLGSSTCFTKTDVSAGLVAGTHTASCNADGYAEVVLYATDSSFTSGDSNVDAMCGYSASASSTCAYHFVLPCKAEDMCVTGDSPVASPVAAPAATPVATPAASPVASPTSCDDSIKLAVDDDSLPLGTVDPITVDSQGTTSVGVTVTQDWKDDDSISWISLVYSHPDGSIVCEKEEGVDPDVTRSITAMCENGVAQIDVYVHDGSFHKKYAASHSNPGYCDGWLNNDSGIVAYTFVVPCTCDGVSDAQVSSTTARTTDRRNLDEEAFTAGVKTTEESAGADDEDVPYCVSADFPCEGEGSDMVYVCHYSARKGYQTFCIPETDSDILRFYPNDYCGPCEGGYGGLWN